MIRRAVLQDVFVEDGRSAVFVHDQVIVLSEIATAILEATPTTRWVSLASITDTVVGIYGPPEPPLVADDLTQEQVLELVAHRVLQLDSAVGHEHFTPDSVEALRDALRHIVSDSREAWALPDGVTGQQLMSAAERHRVVPSLATGAHRLRLPAETQARLGAAAGQEMATVAVLGVELAEIVDALARAGVKVLAFKGLALAVQAHNNVAARGTGDHDLLVAPTDLELSYEVLRSLGWTPSGAFPQPGASWAWGYLVRAYNELSLERRGNMVDLHWHPLPVRTSFPSFDVLWSRRAMVRIGDNDVPTLSPYDALAHSASHSAKDHWRWLRGLLDVHLLLSDPNTWRHADRPLRHDQLLSIGLAGRMFGVPPTAPLVVHQAAYLTDTSWNSALERQSGPAHVDLATRVPGAGLVQGVIARKRAGAGLTDIGRQVVLATLPLKYAADITAPSALVAVPRVLARRAAEVLTLSERAASRRLREITRRVRAD